MQTLASQQDTQAMFNSSCLTISSCSGLQLLHEEQWASDGKAQAPKL